MSKFVSWPTPFVTSFWVGYHIELGRSSDPPTTVLSQRSIYFGGLLVQCMTYLSDTSGVVTQLQRPTVVHPGALDFFSWRYNSLWALSSSTFLFRATLCIANLLQLWIILPVSLWHHPPILTSVYQSSLLQLVSTLLFLSPSFICPFLQYWAFTMHEFSVSLYYRSNTHFWCVLHATTAQRSWTSCWTRLKT